MKTTLMMLFTGLSFFVSPASADATPALWCFNTPDRDQFCDPYSAPKAEPASVRTADEDEAKMFTAFDCIQSANNEIGTAAHISRDIDFKAIKSKALIDHGILHHFRLIKVHQTQFFTKFRRLRNTD